MIQTLSPSQFVRWVATLHAVMPDSVFREMGRRWIEEELARWRMEQKLGHCWMEAAG